jgi:hypothetical protein
VLAAFIKVASAAATAQSTGSSAVAAAQVTLSTAEAVAMMIDNSSTLPSFVELA